MKKLISTFLFCWLLYSCNTLKISEPSRYFSDLAVDWNFQGKINPIYVPVIDSTFGEIIRKFNNEPHSFKIHKRESQDENYVSFTFLNGKFVSKGGLTAAYIISGVGLIVTPVVTLAASGATWFAAFYYLPADRLNFATTLSPSLTNNKPQSKISSLQYGATFSNRSKRMNKMTLLLEKSIYKLLLKLDKQVATRK